MDGQGLFQGAQTQGKFVPAQQTDFIFTVAGEELGFVGAGARRGAARHRAVAGRPHRDAGRGPLRPAGGDRGPLLVRVPELREHRHDAGHHARHRRPAAVRVVRRVVDVRQPASRSGCCRTCTCGGTPDHPRAGYPGGASHHPPGSRSTAMPVESLFPRLEPLLAKVQQAHPVRRRRAQLHRQGLGRVRRPVGADVPRRLRGGRPQPGRHDPLRGPQRAGRRPRRAHLRGVAGHGGAHARARRCRQFTVDAHRPVGAFDVLGVSFATELGYTNLLPPSTWPASRSARAGPHRAAPGRHRRRALGVQPRAGRRLHRRRRAGRRRAGGAGDQRGRPRSGRRTGSTAAGWPPGAAAAPRAHRRGLRPVASTTSTTSRTAGSSGWRPTPPASRGGCTSTP